MRIAAVALLSAFVCAVPATAATFTGYTPYPNGVVSGAALTARNAFLAALTTSSVENFEHFSMGQTGPLNLTFTGTAPANSAVLVGDGSIQAAFNGLFPTSPTREFYSLNAATITFASAVTAFGFYATDVSDRGSNLSLAINGGAGGTYLVSDNSLKPDGNLLFFGITSAAPITSVTFTGAAFYDAYGIDDITIGTAAAVPEPATWAMMIIGFGAVGAAARRKRAATLRLA